MQKDDIVFIEEDNEGDLILEGEARLIKKIKEDELFEFWEVSFINFDEVSVMKFKKIKKVFIDTTKLDEDFIVTFGFEENKTESSLTLHEVEDTLNSKWVDNKGVFFENFVDMLDKKLGKDNYVKMF